MYELVLFGKLCLFVNCISSLFVMLLCVRLLPLIRVTRSLVLYVCVVDRCLSFCTFFLWSLCFLFFFDIRILITPLVSSNTSYTSITIITLIRQNNINSTKPTTRVTMRYMHYKCNYKLNSLSVVIFLVVGVVIRHLYTVCL
jgi:hypothetical protein